ncbi:glycosyltransferase family A protein [Niallia sp. SS-2023]|uniref:glycosyltransferase family 2 protein n=1 Tax=Niallia sp. SS-2023 TaxID=3051155 RepID=UPI00254D41ED|nr:glycosyltransferase family A protein [Niallia sp. SS-2023]MDL0437672.1 glycosyltransferase family A protein [Niallia sp. SS-2023]
MNSEHELKQTGTVITDFFHTNQQEMSTIVDIAQLQKFLSEKLADSAEQKDYLENFNEVLLALLKGKLSEEVFLFYLEAQFFLDEAAAKQIFTHITRFQAFKENSLHDNLTFPQQSAPKVNVIITTYNRERFLEQVIDSILKQDYPNIELIIIDDNSQDGTSSLMEKKYASTSNVIYMRNNKNEGPGTNRLKAFVTHADGEYIFFLDDDDYLIDSNYISKAVHFHEQHPEVSFVAANVFLDKTNKSELKLSDLKLNTIVKKYDYFINFEKKGYPKPASTLTTVFKRSALIEMDIVNMKMVNDSAIYLRSLLVGDAGFLDTVAGVYRIHGNNITFNLKSDFIIENLNEKKTIKNMAVNDFNYNAKEVEDWFGNSVYVTVMYFLKYSAKNANDYFVMLNWTKENCRSIYKKMRYAALKFVIKRRLSRLRNLGRKAVVQKS